MSETGPNLQKSTQKNTEEKENISETLQKILEMKLNSPSESVYNKNMFEEETAGSMQVAEDTFLRNAKNLIKDYPKKEYHHSSLISNMKDMLKRESMKDSPNVALFTQALKELAERENYNLEE